MQVSVFLCISEVVFVKLTLFVNILLTAKTFMAVAHFMKLNETSQPSGLPAKTKVITN